MSICCAKRGKRGPHAGVRRSQPTMSIIMVVCDNGHRYEKRKGYCPVCGNTPAEGLDGALALPRVILWVSVADRDMKRLVRSMVHRSEAHVIVGPDWLKPDTVEEHEGSRIPIVVAASPETLNSMLSWKCVLQWEHVMSAAPAERTASISPKVHGARLKPVLRNRGDEQKAEERNASRRHCGHKHFSERKLCTIRTERDEIIAARLRSVHTAPIKNAVYESRYTERGVVG